ncbi:MAG: TonB-dependent receptor [Gemmatimonadales bacterium]|nr:TonB-dependent receptor [Gemmatimonadales bacterium]
MSLRTTQIVARLTLVVAAFSFGGSVVGGAQELASITGSVKVSEKGPALEGARVTLVGTLFSSVTNARGEFSIAGIVPGKYVIQATAIGYSTLSTSITIKPAEILEVDFETDADPFKLPDLAVRETPKLPAGFERRLASGGGHYFTRDQIVRRNAGSTADLLRMVPGVQIGCRGGRCRVIMGRSGANCSPSYWVDGVQVDVNILWQVRPEELEGIEVYAGLSQIPAEFARHSACGAIALWSRVPPAASPRDKKPEVVKTTPPIPPPNAPSPPTPGNSPAG